MAATRNERDQRVTIWSISPDIIGAYFGILLIQYIPAIVFNAYMHIRQQTANDTFAVTAIEIIKASGPIGIGSAMNAIAIALFVEAIMVLARMLSKQQREEGIKEGSKRENAKWRAWAKEHGIPEEELPIFAKNEDEQDDDQ